MERMPRRAFTKDMLNSLLTFSLVKSISKAEALAHPLRAIVRPWVMEMDRTTKAMRAGTASQKEWQERIQQLLARVDLSDLLRAIDYDTLARRVVFQDRHESVLEIDLPKREGLKTELSFDSFF